MRILSNLTNLTLLVLLCVFVGQLAPKISFADHNTQHTNAQKQAAAAVYNYVAQPGDSFTKMARKAVQSYGVTQKVSLTPAQIIYSETNLTQAAGSPLLEIGQNVSIKKSDVKSWVDKAKALTPVEQTAWNYYVQFVDFNTDRVGVPG